MLDVELADAPAKKKTRPPVLKAPVDENARHLWYTTLANKAEKIILMNLAAIAREAGEIEKSTEHFLLKKFFVHYFGVFVPLNIGRRNGRLVLGRRLEFDCKSPSQLLVSAGVAYKKSDEDSGNVKGYPGSEFFSYARENGIKIGNTPSEERAFLIQQRRALLKKVLQEQSH